MGFRGLIDASGVAGADVISKRLSVNKVGSGIATYTFALADTAKRWRFYGLTYALTFSGEGHATLGANRILVVKLLDSPELLADAWRAELQLSLPATEFGNMSMSGVGFESAGGVVFPVGVDAKVLVETTQDTAEWGANDFARWSARVAFTAYVREVRR